MKNNLFYEYCNIHPNFINDLSLDNINRMKLRIG